MKSFLCPHLTERVYKGRVYKDRVYKGMVYKGGWGKEDDSNFDSSGGRSYSEGEGVVWSCSHNKTTVTFQWTKSCL